MSTWQITVAIFLWRLAGTGGNEIAELRQSDENPIGGSIVWLSATFVSTLFDQPVSGVEEVECEILGTKITGLSRCTGSLVSSIEGAQANADIRCVLKGLIESENIGTNGPAKIDSTTSTSFAAIKIVRFDGVRFTTWPVELDVATSLEITNVDTHLKGIKGVVVKRIASARAEATKEEARAITEELTKKRLAEKIDCEFERQLSQVNRTINLLQASLVHTRNREIRIVTRRVEQNLEVGIVLATTNLNCR
ncbi:MAG: hypothetical protein SGI77_10255 [Pirellulaceae bacterium]|nr:hypothetical protein [Pirellulaceae bacterium]